MAQQYTDYLSWRRGEKPKEPEPVQVEQPRLYVHHDNLSRFIDDLLDGEVASADQWREPRQYANGRPGDWRGWLIFWALMALSIWGMYKVLML